MLDTQKQTGRAHRYGQTRKKMVTLTHEGRQHIQQFADAHSMSFSAAIESLALIGLKADITDLLIPLLREVTDKAIQRNFNRIAKLSLLAAAEAAMAHDLTTMLLLQTIRQTAAAHPQDFETVMQISFSGDKTRDGRIRAIYQEMRQLARGRQQRLLKRSLSDLVAQLAGDTVDIVDDENDEKEGDHG